MGALLAAVFVQLERLIPERARVRIVACLAFLGLAVWIYLSGRIFARANDVEQFKQAVAAQIASAITPLSDKVSRDESISTHRYLDELDGQILQDSARCSETKNAESRYLYQASISQLLRRYDEASGGPYPAAVDCK